MALQGIISVTCRRQAQVRWLSLMQQRVLLKEIMLGIQANPSRDMWFFNPKRVVRLPYPDRDWVAPTKCFAKLLKGQVDWTRLAEVLKVFVMMRFNSVIVWAEVCLRVMGVFLALAFLVVVMGLLQLMSHLCSGIGQTGWFLKVEVKLRNLSVEFSVFLFSPNFLMMNIIIWNCRGARKPSFRKHVGDLVQNYNPAILVVMETRVGGDRAREITNLLPFDGAFHTDTIGYSGGL